MSRRRLGCLFCGIGALLGVTACSSDADGAVPIVTAADAYSAAIRWYLAEAGALPTDTTATADPGPLIVYVAPESGKAIDSQDQASVVAEMADMKDEVTIRFADVRDDALDLDLADLPVKGDGVLLLVGAVTEGAPPVAVDVAVYRNADDEHSFVMNITTADDSFRATAVSEVGQG